MPTSDDIKDIVRMHEIPEEQIICRHGTDPTKTLERFLSNDLYKEVEARFDPAHSGIQPEAIHWPGGYFGFPGALADAKDLPDEVREDWRKEYLPGPTALASLSLCAAVAGLLLNDHPADKRLRVTLHRAMTVGDEELLQQCCEYLGANIKRDKPTAARTFPAANATIGLAYRCRENIRSVKDVLPTILREAMAILDLNAASRRMSTEVGFVLAMPIVQPEVSGKFSGPSSVAGVLYIDSEAPNYFVDDARVRQLAVLLEQFVSGAADFRSSGTNRIRNLPTGKAGAALLEKEPVPDTVASALELVNGVSPPRSGREFQLNFDYADFVPG